MKANITRTLVAALALGITLCAYAKKGAPHSLTATATYDKVTLSWKSPADAKVLKWHNDEAYNGDDGLASDPQKPVEFYAGAKFKASDLTAWVGETIDSIAFYQYRPVVKATVLVYENGKVVSQATADPAKFVKDSFLSVKLTDEVEIKEGAEYIFAVKFNAGQNMDMVAIKNRASNAAGEGDLLSYDGVNWKRTGAGDYLITAILKNDVTEHPSGYAVYGDNTLLAVVNDGLTTCVIDNCYNGTHTYRVGPAYGIGEPTDYLSQPVSVKTNALANFAPAASFAKSSVLDLNVTLNWTAPELGGSTLAWGKTHELGNNIGGTGTKPKVWIRNYYDAADIVAFAGAKINAINLYLTEAVASKVVLWVMEDNVIVYDQTLTDEQLAALKVNDWSKIELTTPYEIQAGHSLAYGYYVEHTKSAHPIGIDNAATIDVKANSFSTTSALAVFKKSKPSWKTLASGAIAGNWMLTADVTDAKTFGEPVTYELTRDGNVIATGLSALTYEDVVEQPATYKYGLTAIADGKRSAEVTQSVKVALPPAYAAPNAEAITMKDGVASFSWNCDKLLSHCGDPAYMFGIGEEEIAAMWGTQFSAAELTAYKDQSISKLNVYFGEGVSNLKVGVYTKTGVAKTEVDLDGLEAGAYVLTLKNPVKITGDEDLILAYSGTLAAGSTPIILDGGPLAENGARVSLTGGATWMNLGTLNASYAKFNVYISAYVTDAPETSGQSIDLGEKAACLPRLVGNIESRELGIDAAIEPKAATAAKPVVDHFNVYRNDELVASTKEYSYSDKLPGFGKYTYNITAVFTTGWESAKSDDLAVVNRIAQLAAGPYDLKGTASGNDLALTWQAPEKATVLSYITGTTRNGLGMTSTNPSAYCLIKFKVEDLEPQVGKNIDYVVFDLLDNNIKSCKALVTIGENIVYSQDVPVSTLVAGENYVRLNKPFVIEAGKEVGVGYFCTYAKGVKPHATDEGPAVVGYGDIISSSASPGYFYSLKTKFKFDQNFRIKAILGEADQELKTNDAEAITYNVYRDGDLVAEGLTAPETTIADALKGTYYVTAVTAAGETAPSNSVLFNVDGISTITVDQVSDDNAVYYNLQGVEVNRESIAPGLYIRKSDAGSTKVIVK